MLVEPEYEVQHGPGHLELHVERELPAPAQVDRGVRGGADDGEGVGERHQAQQADGLGRAPLPGGAVGEGKVGLEQTNKGER